MSKPLTDSQYGEYLLSCFRETKPGTNNGLVAIAVWIAIMVVLVISLIGGCDRAWAQDLTASWYSVESLRQEGTTSYSNNVMANGEKFSDEKMVAASRDWPLGTTVRVTNKANGKSVIVEIADRTNKRFKGKRIDLSKSSFEILSGGRLDKGLLQVTVEEI